MAEASRNLATAIIITVLIYTSCFALTAESSTQAAGNIQNDFLALVNAQRTSLGKNPLAANVQLENAAYLHSKDMGDNNYFSHTSQDGTQFSQRITAQGYTYMAAAENIAKAYDALDAAKVYDMWKNSAGHYSNMIGDYVDAGLGVYSIDGYTYYTLDLGKSRNPTSTLTPKPTVLPTPSPNPTAKPATTLSPTPNPTITPTPTTTASTSPTSPATPTATPPDSPIPSSTALPDCTEQPTSAPTIPELTVHFLLPLMLLVVSLAVTTLLKEHKTPS